MEWMGDIDFIIASGMAAKQKNVGALAFWAKYANDLEREGQLRYQLKRMVIGKARAKRIRANAQDISQCVDSALTWWLHDVCPTCRGVKFQVDNQHLSNRVCTVCSGSGVRHLPTLTESNLDWPEELWEKLIHKTIDSLEQSMGEYLRLTKGIAYDQSNGT
jgi:hypothetical protein